MSIEAAVVSVAVDKEAFSEPRNRGNNDRAGKRQGTGGGQQA
ncbi:hypothetical protein ACYULU_08575 [Breznakiellaceae bacterium SP9]